MTRKNWLILVGVVVLVVLGGIGLSFVNTLQTLTAPRPLTISYETVQTLRPDGSVCAGGEESPGVAKEILNLETGDIYVAGGANPMPDDVWADYRFRLPLFKNSTRNLLFDGSCFFRSPDAAPDCEGDACFTLEEIVGYTWLKLTTIAGDACQPDAGGCSGDVVDEGYVSITTIAKCHEIVYEGPVIYELADGLGNRYVMHATETGVPDVDNPVLPAGWTLRAVEIDEPLVLLPFGGGDACYYNVVRDNLVQSYHQFAYSGDVYP